MITVEKKDGQILIIGGEEAEISLKDEVERLRKEKISLGLELQEIQRVIQNWTKVKEDFWREFNAEKHDKESQLKQLEEQINFLENQETQLSEKMAMTEEKYKNLGILPQLLKERVKFYDNLIGEKTQIVKDLNQTFREKEECRKEINILLEFKTKLENESEGLKTKVKKATVELEELRGTYENWQKDISKLQEWADKLTIKEQKLKEESVKRLAEKIANLKIEMPDKKLKI